MDAAEIEEFARRDITRRLQSLGAASQNNLSPIYRQRTQAERRKRGDDEEAGRIALGQIAWRVAHGLRAVENGDWVHAEAMLREAERFAAELVVLLAQKGRLDHLREGAGSRKGRPAKDKRNRQMAEEYLKHWAPGVKPNVARHAATKSNPELFRKRPDEKEMLSERQITKAIKDGLANLEVK